jgi:hypothetical protein
MRYSHARYSECELSTALIPQISQQEKSTGAVLYLGVVPLHSAIAFFYVRVNPSTQHRSFAPSSFLILHSHPFLFLCANTVPRERHFNNREEIG